MNWNFSLIYKNEEEFEKDFKLIDADKEKLVSYKGKLDNEASFKEFLKLEDEASIRVERLYVYASMIHDTNQKDKEASRRYARIQSKYQEFATAISFADPEIMAIGEEKVMSWLTGDYASYRYPLTNLFRKGTHILSSKEEELLASFGEATGVYRDLYSELTIVDCHDVEVTLSDGKKIIVNKSNMTFYLGTLKNPEDRTLVFEAVYKYLYDHKGTLASIYNGIMKTQKANATARGYNSCLEARLDSENIPVDVYLSLIHTARENTACLKRYYDIRKKYFKLDKIRTYDRFLKFRESKKNYSYPEAKKMVLEAMEFMGPDFHKRAEYCLSEGRVDVAIKDGKRNGAYSTGTYTDGPFILLNHNGNLSDTFTVAHECGHSIHTTYANDTQDYTNANYSLFVAEVASTFNEARFLDYLMENVTDKNERIVLLQQAIDNICSTFFRQALFADYEYESHELVEKGLPVDDEALSNIMKDLYKDYYDINLDDEPYKCMVWSYVSHFYYYYYYVYVYATSFSASSAIYQAIKEGKEGAYEAYINLLKSGGSDYPVELLKKAGVDLTTKEPFLAVVKRMNELLDELEALLKD